MSRHRNVRAMNYNEEYDTYYDVYGQSVEDEMCISPSTAAEFMYNRDGKPHSMSAYLASEGGHEIPEEEESFESYDEKELPRKRAESVTEYPKNLSEVDEAKLRSCVEEMQNVVGETVSEGTLIKAAVENVYDLEKSLNAVLSQAFANEQAKPQRAKKERTEFSFTSFKPQSSNITPIKDINENTSLYKADTCSSRESKDVETVSLGQFIKKLASKNSVPGESVLNLKNLSQEPVLNNILKVNTGTNEHLPNSKLNFNNSLRALNFNLLSNKCTVLPTHTNDIAQKPCPQMPSTSSTVSFSASLKSPFYINMGNSNPALTLADLAKQKSTPSQIGSTFGNFKPALSLADLAKKSTQNDQSTMSKNISFLGLKVLVDPSFETLSANQGLSLADLAKEHLECVEKTVKLPNTFGSLLSTAQSNNQLTLSGMEVKYSGWTKAKHDINETFSPKTFKTLNKCREPIIKYPSIFGFILCMRFRIEIPPKISIFQHLKEQNKAAPTFDFLTPSPDDVMKEKQFQAFRDSVKPTILEDAIETEKEIPQIKTVIVQSAESEKSSEASSVLQNNNTNTNQLNPVKPNRTKSRSPSPAGIKDEPSENTPQSRRQRFSEANTEEAYAKERMSGKPLINLVVIGHVDAGKSTLMGHLLYRLGCVSKKLMHKNEQDSKKLGKSSFMYAWVLDETPEERNRGITMDIAQSKFETKQRLVTLLDAPGHKDFIPNMITGAAQADVAILVVDATRGEFETGFEAGGQTREHAILVRSLGVSQLAVAVNKLDNVDWSKERYDEIVSKLTAFLKQAGYKEKDASFVPCSGLTGENLTELSKSCPLSSWYDGLCLVDIIDNFKPPERPISKPFRMCISDIFKGMGAGFCAGGRVESGRVENGSKVLVLPAGDQATVKGIAIDDVSQSQAFAGDHVSLGLSGVDMNKVMVGDVVCDPYRPVKVSSRFQARIVVFNIDSPLTQGYPVVLHYQSMSEQAVIRKLITQLHKSTGEVVKKKPRFLLKNSSGLIELEVIRPICLELYKDNRDLGRFMLRSGGTTVAAGLVTQVM